MIKRKIRKSRGLGISESCKKDVISSVATNPSCCFRRDFSSKGLHSSYHFSALIYRLFSLVIRDYWSPRHINCYPCRSLSSVDFDWTSSQYCIPRRMTACFFFLFFLRERERFSTFLEFEGSLSIPLQGALIVLINIARASSVLKNAGIGVGRGMKLG